MAGYGIPYMGSKNKILKKLIGLFPKADNFYDLFGGGFSVTHSMMVNRPDDYKQFHFNEIDPNVVKLIEESIAGKYSYENFKPEFIDREKFFSEKDSDAYISLIWSFGNNDKKGYLYGKDREAYKKSIHSAVVFGEFDSLMIDALGFDKWQTSDIKERRLLIKKHLKKLSGADLRLQHLEGVEKLQRLQGFDVEVLKTYSKSYEQIPIRENSVIYCDIPYRNTAKYKDDGLDYERFYDWCFEQDCPVFVSEYNIPDDRFKLVAEFETRSVLSKDSNNTKAIERLYWNGKNN